MLTHYLLYYSFALLGEISKDDSRQVLGGTGPCPAISTIRVFYLGHAI